MKLIVFMRKKNVNQRAKRATATTTKNVRKHVASEASHQADNLAELGLDALPLSEVIAQIIGAVGTKSSSVIYDNKSCICCHHHGDELFGKLPFCVPTKETKKIKIKNEMKF